MLIVLCKYFCKWIACSGVIAILSNNRHHRADKKNFRILFDDQTLIVKNKSMIETIKDLFAFLNHHKKWWLFPILLFLLLLGALVVYSQGTVVAPFVYSFF